MARPIHRNQIPTHVQRPYIDRQTHWRRQLRLTVILLIVWAAVGFGMSILFVEEMNTIRMGDMPLGFWMAQQGSIYVFIVLILIYALLSGKSDREAGLDKAPTRTEA